MASSTETDTKGKGVEGAKKTLITRTSITYDGVPNTRVIRLEANEYINKQDYAILAYLDNDLREINANTTPVCHYKGTWHALTYSKSNDSPAVGRELSWISTWDVPEEDQQDELEEIIDRT